MPPKPTHSRSQSATRESKKNRAAASQKRAHSPDISTTHSLTKQLKKAKPTQMSTEELDCIKSLIANSTASIQQQIQSAQTQTLQHIENKFNQFEANLNNEITTLKSCVDEFKSNVSSELTEINTKLTNHEQRLINNEDDVQRIKRSNDLRIVGFPFQPQENLLDIFEKVSNEIGFNTSQVSTSIERIFMRNRITGEMEHSKTIMVHFALQNHKRLFYSHYLNKMPLKPEKFRLPESNRITVGEHLTPKNAKLFIFALKLKIEKKIAQVYTEDGLIRIRLSKNKQEPSHIVRTVTDIET